MVDYVDMVRWVILFIVVIILVSKVWDVIKNKIGKGKKQEKWEDFLEN